jgi:signal transduction histidine kinase
MRWRGGTVRSSVSLLAEQTMTIAPDFAPAREPTAGSSIFAGAGAMAALCSSYEWANTAIGCPDEWTAGLRAAAALVLAAPTPMVLLWGEDATQIYNEPYRALMGAKHPSVFGTPVKSGWPEGWHLDWELYTRAWGGESIVVDDAIVSVGRAGDSSDASFTLGYSPARDEHGVIRGVLVTAFETSTLAAAQRQASAAVRAKADFLAVMSHELKTPLNAIGGYAELLQLGVRGPITPEQRGDLERIQAGQQQLLGVIDDVLAYTKLEAGILHFVVEDVALDELLTECCALVGQSVRQKKLELKRSGSLGGLAVRADGAKVRQVILNLLTNAINFTDPGGTITVSCHEEHGERVDIAVSDTGRGIALTDLECVFQPFVQVDAKLTRDQDGTGLGLAISRQLAQRMGGDLTVVSEVGTGSRFTLSLACGRSTRRTLE